MDPQKVSQSSKKYSVFTSLTFVWFVTTAVYIAGTFLFGLDPGIGGFLQYPSLHNASTAATLFIGLFVPYGIFNGSYIIDSFTTVIGQPIYILSLISPAILILLMIFNKKMLGGLQNKPVLKLLANILILLAFTALVDISLWHEWRSLSLLFQGFH